MSRELCAQINHDFDDTAYLGALRYDLDDFLHDTAVVEPFRGGRVHVTGPGGYDETEYLDDETGCFTFAGLNTANTYSVTFLSWAVVEGHTIKVFDDDTTPATLGISTTWNPPASPGTTTRTINTGAEVWNIMAAATFAIHRRDLGLSAQTLTRTSPMIPAMISTAMHSTSSLRTAT